MHHGAEMKISRQKIRRMILERMALREHRTMPDAGAIPPQHLDTIHGIIDHGDLSQAQSLVDALGGSPTYAQDYLEYQNVGDMEKLGNRAADILPDSPEEFAARDFMKTDDWKKVRDVDREAYSLSQDKAVEIEDGQEYYNPDAQDIALDRYRGNRDRYIDDESDPDEFLFEHLTAPPVPTNIPLHHLHKIQDLIDGGEIEMARSLIDALGGPVDYVDDYILYSNVGDMEKLGNQAYDARSTYDRDSLELTNALKNIDREAVGIAHKRGQMIDGDAHSIFGGSGSFQSDMRRYVGNRDRPLSEHRIAPSLNLPGVPQDHVDKIHDLISDGELEMAQSLIDAFGGPPNYARDYQMYDEVGDLEKLGNRAADVMSRVPKTERGWSTMSDMQPVYDIDKHAYDSVNSKIERGELPADTTWDRDYMRDRYFNIRNNTLPHTFVDHRGDKSPTYFDDDGNPLNEHRIAPPPLDLLGLPQSHIDKIHDLINTGDFDQAQTFIDAFGGDPNWVENYRAYEEVGDLEKLGNARADILANADYSDPEWYESDDYRQLEDLDNQAYRLGADKVSRGLAPGFDGTTKPGARTHASYPYMRDRYMRGMGSVKPLNEHNSNRAGLRRMILQEMSSMGIGGQPPMSIDAMMQELQRIEAQLEEMEMERQDYLMTQERFGVDPIEAAYGYEMEYPDYYDDKEELQSRAYELEEMIEAAGGPTL